MEYNIVSPNLNESLFFWGELRWLKPYKFYTSVLFGIEKDYKNKLSFVQSYKYKIVIMKNFVIVRNTKGNLSRKFKQDWNRIGLQKDRKRIANG